MYTHRDCASSLQKLLRRRCYVIRSINLDFVRVVLSSSYGIIHRLFRHVFACVVFKDSDIRDFSIDLRFGEKIWKFSYLAALEIFRASKTAAVGTDTPTQIEIDRLVDGYRCRDDYFQIVCWTVDKKWYVDIYFTLVFDSSTATETCLIRKVPVR